MTIKQQGGIFGRNPTFNTVTATQFVGPISGLATSAAALASSATTGLMQITGPAAGQTRTMTTPDANFTAARTDAGQTFTGVQVMTSPNIVTSINDINGNEVFGITATASAVNELTVANAATGGNPTISATGTDTNIGVTITPKGTGNLVLAGGNLVVANGAGIDFSATSGTGTSELFDDYEEGTWTPVISVGSTGTATANYTKIGNMVTVTCKFVFATVGVGAQNITWASLPFTPSLGRINGTCQILNAGVAWYSGVAIGDSVSDIQFTTTGDVRLTNVAPFILAANDELNFTITYRAD